MTSYELCRKALETLSAMYPSLLPIIDRDVRGLVSVIGPELASRAARIEQLEAAVASLRERAYGYRELWCDICDMDACTRAQKEANEHGVPVHVNTHGVRQFTAYPSRIAELERENEELKSKIAHID